MTIAPTHPTALAASVAARREESLEFLSDVVKLETVSGYEDRAARAFTSWFEQRGWPVEQQVLAHTAVGATERGLAEPRMTERANITGWFGPRTGKPVVTVNAHYDVVPVMYEEDWSDAPFGGVRRDGAVFGRGSVDNKGGCVSAMYALQALADAGVELAFDLAVELIAGEETTGLGTIASLEALPERLATIVMEPTDGAVVPANSGVLFFTIEVAGRDVHTSQPWRGEDALAKLVSLYQAVNALGARRAESHRHPLMDHVPTSVPLVIGVLNGGGWRAAVPAHASMSGRIGVLPGESLQEVRDALTAAVSEAAAGDPWLVEHPPTLRWDNDGSIGWELPLENALVSSFTAAQRALGEEPLVRGLTAGCDAGVLRGAGIPAVVFGPGDLSRAHSVDEYVLDDEVERATAVLATTLVELSAAVERGELS
ncbi:M20 family metallopeptidase [Herbiconiux sp. A18JL235]|uniref:M20 family metallopeptidase n=1 Tax=Herbiconiux sp. A18JL235 TaxID=3152363 RepID=A0AB39BD80_9MICO